MVNRLLLIDNYDSFTFNLAQLFSRYPVVIEVRRNDSISLEELPALAPDCVCLSPGPGRPADAGACIDIAKALLPNIPLLGVCLGMQAINEAFGGRTVHAPVPVHGKTSRISHIGGALFTGIPSPFTAMRYHSLCVADVPAAFEVSAMSDDNVIMAISHLSRPVFGVQFHPESFRTDCGTVLVENFLRLVTESRDDSGWDETSGLQSSGSGQAE